MQRLLTMKNVLKTLLLSCLLFSLASCSIFTSNTAGYFPSKGGNMRIVTYNVGTFTKSGDDQTPMVCTMMKEMDADIVCLNELDSCARRTSNYYQLMDFAVRMGAWNYSFAPAMPFQGGSYGIGMASKPKLRIKDKWSMVLPKGKGSEPRALCVVEFDRVVVAATHLEHTTESARLAQVQTITAALKERYAGKVKPVILAGDMNAAPDSKTLSELQRDWTVVSAQKPTYDSSKPKQCIDYILVMKDAPQPRSVKRSAVCTRFLYGDVSVASDHLPVYVDLKP